MRVGICARVNPTGNRSNTHALIDQHVEHLLDDFSFSFVRALDIGGLVREGEASYPTVHAALLALDAAISS